jgi:hypothetical protein
MNIVCFVSFFFSSYVTSVRIIGKYVIGKSLQLLYSIKFYKKSILLWWVVLVSIPTPGLRMACALKFLMGMG